MVETKSETKQGQNSTASVMVTGGLGSTDGHCVGPVKITRRALRKRQKTVFFGPNCQNPWGQG